MPRTKRKESETKIYNVTIKGANSQLMFYDAEDHKKFLAALERACEKCEVRLAARVLMSNHVHLVVHAELGNMARFFKSVGASYVYYYNHKYARTGPLWNARFYSDPVETEEAYKQATAYIYNNPVAAKIAETPDVYAWSNFRAVTDGDDPRATDGDDPRARAAMAEVGDPDEILQYALDYSQAKKLENYETASKDASNECFTDDEVAAFVKNSIGGASITNIINLGEKVQLNLLKGLLELGSSVCQMSRVTGISLGRIDALLA